MFTHPLKSQLYPTRGKRKVFRLSSVLFIDPGLGGTGWAYWQTFNTNSQRMEYPYIFGSFKPKTTPSWQGQAEAVWSWFEVMLKTLPKDLIIVMECPEAWLANTVGLAAVQKGTIFKLMYLVGGMAEVIRASGVRMPIVIYPREWKGQLPKLVMQHRLGKLLPALNPEPENEHEWDAIGMGIAGQGRL